MRLAEKGTGKRLLLFMKNMNVLQNFLMHTAKVSKVAEDDACKIEHSISDEVFEGIKKF